MQKRKALEMGLFYILKEKIRALLHFLYMQVLNNIKKFYKRA